MENAVNQRRIEMEKARRISRLARAWALAVSFIAFSAVVSSAENLIPNPAIEDVISADEARRLIAEGDMQDRLQRIQYFQLHPGELVPLDWRIYSGGGYGAWGATEEYAYTGKYSIFLRFVRLQEFEHLEEGFAALFLHTASVEVEPDTQYEFSFMIKGDVPIVTLKGFLFDEKDERLSLELSGHLGGLRRDGVALRGIPRRGPLKITSGDDWVKYSCVVGTRPDTRRLQMRIGIDDLNQPLSEGLTFYLDDVRLVKRQ